MSCSESSIGEFQEYPVRSSRTETELCLKADFLLRSAYVEIDEAVATETAQRFLQVTYQCVVVIARLPRVAGLR